MNIIHSSLDKQTTATQEPDTGEFDCSGNVSYGKVKQITATQESDTGEIDCSGNISYGKFKLITATQESDTGEFDCSANISYGKVTMKSDGFKNEEDGNENNYDYF